MITLRRNRQADREAKAQRWHDIMSVDTPPRPRADGKPAVVFAQSSGWGSAVRFNGYVQGEHVQRVYGFRPWRSQPVVGDQFHTPMTSGEMGVWVFIKVDPCRDPDDMFTANVRWWGFAKDLPSASPEETQP